MRVRERALPAALAAAYALFAATFRGPRERFWSRMTLTAGTLGGMALAADPGLRRTRVRAGDVLGGAAAAGALYGIFRLGDRVARRIVPTGAEDIDAVYELRRLERPGTIALRLVLVIGPAEELFWRGFVQSRLTGRFGRAGGAVLGSFAYGGAHAVTANPTLVAAATVAGSFWSALAATGASMGTLIASHVLWDLLIFLVAPTTRPR